MKSSRGQVTKVLLPGKAVRQGLQAAFALRADLGFFELGVADFAWLLRGNGLFQADAEGAFLRGYYDLALARQPPNRPFENGAFTLHQLLELRERKLAVGIESVPNGTRHLAYVFLDGKSHSYYVISIQP
jgi:hypothetical protein